MPSAPSAKHILIVGGGVIGFASAYYLLKRGFRVTVLERDHSDAPNCSTGNAGMVVPSHFIPLAAPGIIWQGIRWMMQPESPFSIRLRPNMDLLRWVWHFYQACSPERVRRAIPVLCDLGLKSRQLFLQLRDEGLEFGLNTQGLTVLCKSRQAFEHEAALARQAETLGFQARVVDAKALAELDPAMTVDVVGGVYFPQDCHLDPAVFLHALRGRVVQLGGEVFYDTHINQVAQRNGRIECLRSGETEWKADEYVLAGGVWTCDLASAMGLRIPLQPGKGYSITLDRPPQCPRICAILVEARVAVTPMNGKLRIGGTMEIGRLDNRVNERRLTGIRKAVTRYLPAFSMDDLQDQPVWSGLRPCSPDGLPYVGRPRRYQNLTIAAGHAMLGLSLGPVTGWLVSQILAGETPKLDIALLDPERYGRRRT